MNKDTVWKCLIVCFSIAAAVGGSLLAWPGESGRHMAGLVLIIAALYGVTYLMGRKKSNIG